MPLFRRRRPEPPEWASFFDADRWHAFSELVRYEAGRRRWDEDVQAGVVVHEGERMGLDNLAQLCHAAPGDDWPEIVARHFATLDDRSTAQFDSPEAARAVLRARLIDDAYLAAGIEPARRRVADDLHLALAYDLPTRVELPRREDVLAWGDEDELFELALAQTRAGTEHELQSFDYGGDEGGPTTIWALTGESFFTATHALWIDTVLPPPSEHGTLVAVPNRHTVLFHPIRDVSVVDAVTRLIGVTDVAWTEGPGSLSRSLYWLRDGQLVREETRVTGGDTWFAPSDALMEVLNRLE